MAECFALYNKMNNDNEGLLSVKQNNCSWFLMMLVIIGKQLQGKETL